MKYVTRYVTFNKLTVVYQFVHISQFTNHKVQQHQQMEGDTENPQTKTVRFQCPSANDTQTSNTWCQAFCLLLIFVMVAAIMTTACTKKCFVENQCSPLCQLGKHLYDFSAFVFVVLLVVWCFLCCGMCEKTACVYSSTVTKSVTTKSTTSK